MWSAVIGVVNPAEADPAHELERQLAVIWVRLNCWQHPLTGDDMSRSERAWFLNRMRAGHSVMLDKGCLASEEAIQRVWMHPEWLDKRLPVDGKPLPVDGKP